MCLALQGIQGVKRQAMRAITPLKGMIQELQVNKTQVIMMIIQELRNTIRAIMMLLQERRNNIQVIMLLFQKHQGKIP